MFILKGLTDVDIDAIRKAWAKSSRIVHLLPGEEFKLETRKYKMDMNQVAIAYRDDRMNYDIKGMLGLHNAEWIKDTVRSEVTVRQSDGSYVQGINTAELEFCMAMGGKQFELIKYVGGPNWITTARNFLDESRLPFVAHIGFHLDEGEDWPPMDSTAELVQEAKTFEHSNPEVNKAGRRYHYRIFRVGYVYMKFIKRLSVTA